MTQKRKRERKNELKNEGGFAGKQEQRKRTTKNRGREWPLNITSSGIYKEDMCT